MTEPAGAGAIPGSGRRFALVGIVNTTIDFVLFGLLSLAGLPLLLANLVSTSAGLTFSFVANRAYTFRSTAGPLRLLGPFVLVTGVGLWLIQPLVIAGVGGLAGEDADALREVWVPKGCAIAVGLVWNFLWYRFVVFAPRVTRPPAAGEETR